MRVVLFADSPRENWPSMDRYARSLFAALQQIAPEHEFRLLVPPDPPIGLRGRLFLLWRMVWYPLWARGFAANVYHILDHSYGHLLWGLDGDRTVVTIHDVAPLFFPGHFLGLSSLAWRIAWKGDQKAKWWITVSNFTRCEALNFVNKNPEEVIPIPEGVEPHFHPLPEEQTGEWRERLGLGTEKVILHVGHCQPRKNLERLLTALALLSRKGVAFHFVQVGGVFTPAQRCLLASSGIEHRVRQMSHVSEETLVGLYNIADVFVLPSLYEGFGLPVLEAMACGTPVVAANVASLPEVVGDAGLLVNPHSSEAMAEGILRVLTDPSLADRLRERGLQRARDFTWERTACETLAVYQKVAQGL
ncbi:MAG: glycosyltransferase family 4 protein [Chloroflexi bacterium]|nr:glycosyltransferase family 4 protein [Chloroflexota bacterium]